MTEEGKDVVEAHYRRLTSRSSFALELKQFNLYYAGSSLNQQLQVQQQKGMTVIYGVLKLYWGTQRVIRLRKEELSWKRKSTRMAYENGLDERLMHAMGSGARRRRSLNKLRDSFSEIQEDGSKAAEEEHHEEGNGVFHPDETRLMTASLPRDGAKLNFDAIAENEEECPEVNSDLVPRVLSSTMPKNCKLRRRTLSFSGHLYNGKTRVFRPKYGTVSHVRVVSTQSTQDVIKLLLNKFAVENPSEEFSLFSVSNSGGTQELKSHDFPLLKRIQLGPDENIAKIFIMEKKSAQVSPEVAQYVNLQFTVLEAILRKYSEEEAKEVESIKKRYSNYRANLVKKIELISEAKNKKTKERKKSWWK